MCTVDIEGSSSQQRRQLANNITNVAKPLATWALIQITGGGARGQRGCISREPKEKIQLIGKREVNKRRATTIKQKRDATPTATTASRRLAIVGLIQQNLCVGLSLTLFCFIKEGAWLRYLCELPSTVLVSCIRNRFDCSVARKLPGRSLAFWTFFFRT